MKKNKLLFLLLLPAAVYAQQPAASLSGIFAEAYAVPFFIYPVPVGAQVGYEHYFGQDLQSPGIRAGVVWLWRPDGRPVQANLQFTHPIGGENHFFVPSAGLSVGYESVRVEELTGQVFSSRKVALTPTIDLSYRYQFSGNGLSLKAGLAGWTAPLHEWVLENTFSGDGKYEGNFIRPAFVFGVGKLF
jgi:hypothetical protein